MLGREVLRYSNGSFWLLEYVGVWSVRLMKLVAIYRVREGVSDKCCLSHVCCLRSSKYMHAIEGSSSVCVCVKCFYMGEGDVESCENCRLFIPISFRFRVRGCVNDDGRKWVINCVSEILDRK